MGIDFNYISPVPWYDPVPRKDPNLVPYPQKNPNTIPKIPGVPVIPPLPPQNPSYPKYAAQCGECGMLIPAGSWMYVCPNGRCPVQPKVTC